MNKLLKLFLAVNSIFFLVYCKSEKKFTANPQERATYTAAYEYLKNLEKNIAQKEIEPNAKTALLNAAAEIAKFGDVDNLEKTIPYEYFQQSLQRAQIFVAQFKQDSVSKNLPGFKEAEINYNKTKSKLIALAQSKLAENLKTFQLEDLQKDSYLFLANQIRKYDLATFLNKTMIPYNDLDKSLENMNKIVDYVDINKTLDDLLK